eukprot:scaffold79_cov259-Pinguiococcus_pyrenoidosus.AAC.44
MTPSSMYLSNLGSFLLSASSGETLLPISARASCRSEGHSDRLVRGEARNLPAVARVFQYQQHEHSVSKRLGDARVPRDAPRSSVQLLVHRVRQVEGAEAVRREDRHDIAGEDHGVGTEVEQPPHPLVVIGLQARPVGDLFTLVVQGNAALVRRFHFLVIGDCVHLVPPLPAQAIDRA